MTGRRRPRASYRVWSRATSASASLTSYTGVARPTCASGGYACVSPTSSCAPATLAVSRPLASLRPTCSARSSRRSNVACAAGGGTRTVGVMPRACVACGWWSPTRNGTSATSARATRWIPPYHRRARVRPTCGTWCALGSAVACAAMRAGATRTSTFACISASRNCRGCTVTRGRRSAAYYRASPLASHVRLGSLAPCASAIPTCRSRFGLCPSCLHGSRVCCAPVFDARVLCAWAGAGDVAALARLGFASPRTLVPCYRAWLYARRGAVPRGRIAWPVIAARSSPTTRISWRA